MKIKKYTCPLLLKLLWFIALSFLLSTQAMAITISGTCKQADRVTDCTDTGTIRIAMGGTLLPQTQSIVAGTWSITGVTLPTTGFVIVTVFIDGAAEHQEAVAVVNYDLSGDITGVELIETHLSIGSDDARNVSNLDISRYDNSISGDEDIFYDVDASGHLTVGLPGNAPHPTLYVKSNGSFGFQPGAETTTHHVYLNGLMGAGSHTINVGGDWDMTNGTFNRDTSTVNFTGSGTIQNLASPWWNKSFYNLTASAVGQTTTINPGLGIVVKNTLTLGTGILDGGSMILNQSGTPFVTAGATLNNSTFKYSPPQGGQANITVADYPSLWLSENSSSNNSTFTLLGDITCNGLQLHGNGAGKITTLNTMGNHISCQNLSIGSTVNNRKGKLIVINSVLNITGNIDVVSATSGIDNELDAGNSTINIGGEFRNYGLFSSGTSNIVFNGSNNQRVVSSGDPFYDITLDNTGGGGNNVLTLADSLTVNNDLTVNDGKLDTTTNNYSITVAGHFDQSSLISEVEARASVISVGGDFSADGTLDSSNYNNASLVLTGTGSLLYDNLFQHWRNGFRNLTVGQSGHTSTLSNSYKTFSVLRDLTIGSGTLTGNSTIYLHKPGAPLNLNPNATISIYRLKFFGSNQTIPSLNNGYDCHIWLSRNNTVVTQTGSITLNSGQDLLLNGDGFIARAIAYQTNGFDLNIGGNLQLGEGADTALKTLDISNSTITVQGNIDIRTGTNALIATNSTVTLNGSGAQTVTTNGKVFDGLTITNPSSSGVTFNDSLTTNTFTNTTPNSKMTFTSGESYTVNNAVNLQGAIGQPITLAPSTPSSYWDFSLNAGATKTLDYLDVSWSDASGSDASHKPLNPNNTTRTGNNINWFPAPLGVTKSSTLISDLVNGTGVGKNHIPGAIVAYSILVQNTEDYSPDANTVVIYDALDTNVEFDVGTGVQFSDGSNSSGLALGTVSYSHRSTPTSYTYTPIGSFDPNVAGIKIETTGTFAFGGSPAPAFTLSYRVRVQ